MEILPGAIEELTARLDLLERRVQVLEHPSAAPVATVQAAAPSPEIDEGLSLAQAGGALSVLAYALLGIAGAYVLRYIAESTSLPRLLISALAMVYALLWLVAAARVPVKEWFSSTVYAGTSALILAPMLWELTLRFQVLSAPATAAILDLFIVVATALAWKQKRTPLFWVANAAAAAAALALAVASHQLIPFIATLLLMALLCESTAMHGPQRSLRLLVAAAADLAIWALIFIYSSPTSTRLNYPPQGAAVLILPGCLLFIVYMVSIAYSTMRQGRQISAIETGQAMIAFLLAAAGVLYFAPDAGAIALGAACLLFSIAAYAAALLLFGKSAAERNFQVFAAWAACLLLAGSALCLPPVWKVTTLGLAAIAVAAFASRLAIRLHGLVYLLAAAIVSGLLDSAFHALAGGLPAHLAPGASFVAACAMACYAAGIHEPQQNRRQQLLHLAAASMAALALAALLLQGLLYLAALRIALLAHHVAFLRTLVLCALALTLAKAGSRWRRVELTRIAYATLGLLALKLLMEDLPLGHLELIAASIFLFAITLFTLPRLGRTARKPSVP